MWPCATPLTCRITRESWIGDDFVSQACVQVHRSSAYSHIAVKTTSWKNSLLVVGRSHWNCTAIAKFSNVGQKRRIFDVEPSRINNRHPPTRILGDVFGDFQLPIHGESAVNQVHATFMKVYCFSQQTFSVQVNFPATTLVTVVVKKRKPHLLYSSLCTGIGTR